VVGRVWSSKSFLWVLEILSSRMISSSVHSNCMVSSGVELVRHLPLASSSSSSSSSLGTSCVEITCCLMLVSVPGVLGVHASQRAIASGAFVQHPLSSSSFCVFCAKMCSVLWVEFCVVEMLTT